MFTSHCASLESLTGARFRCIRTYRTVGKILPGDLAISLTGNLQTTTNDVDGENTKKICSE